MNKAKVFPVLAAVMCLISCLNEPALAKQPKVSHAKPSAVVLKVRPKPGRILDKSEQTVHTLICQPVFEDSYEQPVCQNPVIPSNL